MIKRVKEKISTLVNKNIGRKIIFMMIPSVCIIMIATFMLINQIYTDKYISNIEDESKYVTETFKLNLDFCTGDMKILMNAISVSDGVKNLVTMDEDNMNYTKLLESQRELKRTFSSQFSMKSYIQDIFIIGKNGYQYNYLGNVQKNIVDTDWFKEKVDTTYGGFQYIMPHDVDYYTKEKNPSKSTMSIVLAIKSENEICGYVVCDINMEKAAKVPEKSIENGKTYLVNTTTGESYNFEDEKVSENEEFVSSIDDSTSNFLVRDDEFIVYSGMENSAWSFVEIYQYRDIIAAAGTAKKIGIIMLIISCGLIIIVSYVIADFIKRPLNELAVRMQQVGQQNFETVPIKHKQSQPGEIVVIRNRFEEMTEQIDELVNKVYMDEIYQKNMEYENLVNQINPHFIYNVLQLIQSKAVLSENYEIDDIVVSLSRMMRYTMSNNSKIVTIKEETDYVRNYLDLYQKRYSHKFVYDINIEDELLTHPVLKFMLQPIVENCIKHGFKNVKQDGKIRIDIYRNEDFVYFKVKDNGHGMSEEELEELKNSIEADNDEFKAIGLKNTYKRIKLTYGNDADMKIYSTKGEGTTVICSIK